LLKEEMRLLGSLILESAAAARVPAGRALAVDRHLFSAEVEERLRRCPEMSVVRREATEIPDAPIAIIATGPLTSPALSGAIAGFVGADNLFFYDALAPIVTAESVDPDHSYWASRYDTPNPGGAGTAGPGPGLEPGAQSGARSGTQSGTQSGVQSAGDRAGDYLNCPMDRDEYIALREALVDAPLYQPHEFELGRGRFFEGCLPVEVLAARGEDTMRFGPLRPVGLTDPRTGRRPYAVLQLRREDVQSQLLNLVGCQTNLTQAAQRDVFRLVPALRGAEFVRYGAMHRNTYLRGPQLLLPTMESRARPGLFFAGQLTGVEGYTESAASGLLAGIGAAARALGREPRGMPETTVMGALARYVSSAVTPDFQPMNANFGLLPLPHEPHRRRDRPLIHLRRSVEALAAWAAADETAAPEFKA
jgi:methylenetetrahydrofolate--tRNA-(uracil-5-)-methyltransferase